MRSKTVLTTFISFVLIAFLFASCSENKKLQENDKSIVSKISFDLNLLNDDGLYGPPGGLRALDYKFCIPKNEKFKNEVMQIDTALQIYSGNGEKQNCSTNEYLCTGNTHRKNFRQVLLNLASLEYVKKIEQNYWEK